MTRFRPALRRNYLCFPRAFEESLISREQSNSEHNREPIRVNREPIRANREGTGGRNRGGVAPSQSGAAMRMLHGDGAIRRPLLAILEIYLIARLRQASARTGPQSRTREKFIRRTKTKHPGPRPWRRPA